jgi:hypothetical protein
MGFGMGILKNKRRRGLRSWGLLCQFYSARKMRPTAAVYDGCCVVTKQGIIGHEKGFHWIPVDQYKVLSDDMPIEENLRKIRAGILED